jgi:hypothetical protein
MKERKEKGSLTFGTSIMNAEEFFIFAKAAIEGGVDMNTAYDDAKMIDDMLHFKRLHLAVFNHVKYTRAGHVRKDATIYKTYEAMIESRITK